MIQIVSQIDWFRCMILKVTQMDGINVLGTCHQSLHTLYIRGVFIHGRIAHYISMLFEEE